MSSRFTRKFSYTLVLKRRRASVEPAESPPPKFQEILKQIRSWTIRHQQCPALSQRGSVFLIALGEARDDINSISSQTGGAMDLEGIEVDVEDGDGEEATLTERPLPQL